MIESTIEPGEIEIDTITGGVARLLCHWNITTIEREGSTLYQYDESVLKWALPDTSNGSTISTRADVETYVSANSTEIMSFAKAMKLNL